MRLRLLPCRRRWTPNLFRELGPDTACTAAVRVGPVRRAHTEAIVESIFIRSLELSRVLCPSRYLAQLAAYTNYFGGH